MSTNFKFDRQEETHLPIFRTRRQGLVLLIEADANIRETLKLLLYSQGYEVLMAANMAKACTMSRFRGFTFILFNRCMEGEAGGNLYRQIRLANKTTPIFFYNSPDHEPESASSLEANLQGYDAQSITANAMLKAIFLHFEKDRNIPSLTDENPKI
jgi:DNA-binding response OmpR family regulator